MVRNITVGISDELIERMNTLTDVNWSAVTRNCIENYIKQRSSEGLESAILIVRSMKEKGFADGYSYLVKNSDKFTLGGLQAFSDGYWNLEKFGRREITDQEEADKEFDFGTYEQLFYSTNPDLKALGLLVDVMVNEDESESRIYIGRDFILGMMEAARDLFQKSG